jgi:hypothetical protein
MRRAAARHHTKSQSVVDWQVRIELTEAVPVVSEWRVVIGYERRWEEDDASEARSQKGIGTKSTLPILSMFLFQDRWQRPRMPCTVVGLVVTADVALGTATVTQALFFLDKNTEMLERGCT